MHPEYPLPLRLPEELSDEAAAALVECLHELAGALENRYFAQLRRHYHRPDPRQASLWSEEEIAGLDVGSRCEDDRM